MFDLKPWHMAAMEEAGYGTTSTALVNRVANYLIQNGSDSIDWDEFVHACLACGVDPYSFDEADFRQLQSKLNDA